MAASTFAAINVGSFELELGIYEISNKNRIRRLDHIRHVIDLGRDAFREGKISLAVTDEICTHLEDFTRIMNGYGVSDYRAYTTAVMREARNSRLVLDQIRVRTGIKLRVISNAEQRFLNYKAIAALDEEFDKNIRRGTAIVDVGFGSMQLSLFEKNLLVSTENLPLGVLRIYNAIRDTYTTVDRTRQLVEEMVDIELAKYKKMYLKNWEVRHLIGIGEPILYLFRYENDGKPLMNVTRKQFEDLYARLSVMKEEEIESKFGVSAAYARLMLPGAVIYRKVLEMTGAEQIWVPGTCFCDGIAAEYAADSKLLKFRHSFENDIISASRSMANRYRCYGGHSQTVEEYALAIFDAMKKYHGLGKRDRLLLQIAVIIHACGSFISVHNANECAYNIIMSTEIIGLSPLEQEIIANVVRYNIRDFDYDLIHLEAELTAMTGKKANREDAVIRIAKLTAILRLADSMDRGHGKKLNDCRIAVKNDKLTVTTDYGGDLTLETVSFGNKAAFFEEIFGLRPVLKQKRSV